MMEANIGFSGLRSDAFNMIYFVNDSTGWIAGSWEGDILKTGNSDCNYLERKREICFKLFAS